MRQFYFEVFADEPERAMRFYGALFGWSFVSVQNTPGVWTINDADRAEAELGLLWKRPGILLGSAKTQSQINGYVALFSVSSIEETRTTAAREGGIAMHAPTQQPGGASRAYIMDTEGNVFGVVEQPTRH